MFNSLHCLPFIVVLALPCVATAQACPPQPARPFLEFQVERPAVFIPDSTVTPYPAPQQPGNPRPARFTLVSFVVDTLGHPDTATYRVIRDDEPGLAGEGRAVVARWRYRSAQIRGCAVPQLVQTPLARVAK
jgi:hypothetical protein